MHRLQAPSTPSFCVLLLALMLRPCDAAEVGIAGTPELSHLGDRRDAGLALIIDLRNPDEGIEEEAAAARAAGIRYVNLPVGADAADAAVVARVGDLLDAQAEGTGVLLHCASGNRASEVWARHLIERGAEPEAAIAAASATGLSEKRAGYVRAAAAEAATSELR